MTANAPPVNGQFLFDADLSERIRDVTRGDNVRCAVAFWSTEGITRVFDDEAAARRARIVCDISMGSTSADALIALGAPGRETLRHLRGMHAKVYLSDRGVIVGSANASASALSTVASTARLTETGIHHLPGSAAWKAAAGWFETLCDRSDEIGDDEIEWARRAYRPPTGGMSRPPVVGSLLDRVRLAPERFAGAGFVFTSVASDDDEIAAARKSAKRLGGTVAKKEIDKWPRGGFFTDWSYDDVTSWPTLFFEFWQPARKLTVFAKTVGIHDPGNGSIMSRNAWRTAKKVFGADLPTREAIAGADADMAARILAGPKPYLFTDAHALARRLAELDAADAASRPRRPR